MKNIIVILCVVCFIGCQKTNNFQEREFAKWTKELRSAQEEFEKFYIDTRISSIKNGQGLFQAMAEINIDSQVSLQLINALRDEVEFSKLKVGDTLEASFNHQSKLVAFSFSQNLAQKHMLKSINDTWVYEFVEEETIWRPRLIEGNLSQGETLSSSLSKHGLSGMMAAKVSDILMCKINFRFDARADDNFKVFLNERWYEGQVIESKILYTSYNGPRTGFHESFFYDDDVKSTYTAHYTAEGEALIRSGLRYPVGHLHIRSGYGKRRHPVTGKIAYHRGVDLRGRIGAPVYAVAHGRVIESKYTEYGGNKVAIRHADSSISYYLHLNKRFVKKGDVVKSHQQIGQVGKTGRVTGPHLHFGFKNAKGRWMNPMHKRMIATPKLAGERLLSLKNQIDKTKNLMIKYKESRVSHNQEIKRNLSI